MTPDPTDFGPNQWLIDEMYRQYVEDPESVGEPWQEFFRDYRPRGTEAPAKAPDRTPTGDGPPAAKQEAPPSRASTETDGQATALRGIEATIARRMEESLDVPTATSMRTVPARLLEVNRTIVNGYLARSGGGKVSFTHLIGYAVLRALAPMPGMNVAYREVDGKPGVVRYDHVTLGLAVDVKRDDGSRVLLVPNIKGADELNFAEFHAAYEEMIRKVSTNTLTPDDFAGTTVTITNPGMLGTVQSVPRLMAGQAAIVGVGSIDYPAEFAGADPRALADIGVGKVLTLTSTYDHRVIQGAESGEFLARVHRLLLGDEDFYEEVFRAMGVAYVPVHWNRDVNPVHDSIEAEEKQARARQLINMYRVRGHLIAPLDPLEAEPPSIHPELDPATYGFTIWDLDRPFVTGGLAGERKLPLGEILRILRDAYCRTATVEYMHMEDPGQKRWIQEHVEGVDRTLTKEEHLRILHDLNRAEAFERFLHQKYVGHKRFSLEGGESLIPMLVEILEQSGESGIEEVVIGMAHRGRLNVLANVVGRSYEQIFREFEGDIDPDVPQGSGDVKYHLGASGVRTTVAGREIKISLASNPSHLEAVDPVVEGMARAKQDLLDRGEAFPILPILIHGDAAFAGQGVVAETLTLSQLSGYRTGGTVHVIVNNQLGFTTGSDYARSSTYATDVAKMVQAPIFHVNGDDPEACVRVAKLAYGFRQAFHKDVVIDMWCYRRWGHNEGDDPAFTQPMMYRRIEGRRSVRKLYTETLVNRGALSIDEAEELLGEFEQELSRAFEETREPSTTPAIEWKRPVSLREAPAVETAVDRATLDRVLEAITSVPEGFHPHPKLAKWLEARREALAGDAVDWALAEALAFGTVLIDGRTIRFAGQDTRRGTFSQRHSALVDQDTGEEYVLLANIPEASGKFLIYDSLLSEFAALGFEFGYSTANPEALVLWEAQFGDFSNEAQVIIDQFISAAEDKWGQPSGLGLLLPHGYEGQGPEHSSARLERFLMLGAEENIVVTVPSTPAQYFHLLRRQAHRAVRKPLVVMTPKSLLRLPAARSRSVEFSEGRFLEVLDDPTNPTGVSRVILCQGKVFFDLLRFREEKGIVGAALVRLEEPYPFPVERLQEIFTTYDHADEFYWVQEEPENMGAWRHVELLVRRKLGIELSVISREERSSPATGSLRIHQREQEALIEQAFAGLKQKNES